MDDQWRDDPMVVAWTTDGVMTGVCGVYVTGDVTHVDAQWRDDLNVGMCDRRRDECGR